MAGRWWPSRRPLADAVGFSLPPTLPLHLAVEQVTWLGCIRGGDMMISHGFAWDACKPSVLEVRGHAILVGLAADWGPPLTSCPAVMQHHERLGHCLGYGGAQCPICTQPPFGGWAAPHYSVCGCTQALLWLSLQGLGQDGLLTNQELPPWPRLPSTRAAAKAIDRSRGRMADEGSSSDGGGSKEGCNDGGGSSNDGGGSGGGDGAGSGGSSGFVQWCVVPPSPNGGVLGYGSSGEVLAGRQVWWASPPFTSISASGSRCLAPCWSHGLGCCLGFTHG